ncbi:MAG: vitamin K epoxide reductase family protein [Dermatophilaceae bacterium]
MSRPKTPGRVRAAYRTVPGWLAPTSLGLCVLGLAVSAYLTYDHITGGGTLACPEGETVNCAKVTESQWSSVFGVPVAPLGLVFFLVLVPLVGHGAFRRPGSTLDRLRLGWLGVGLAMVFYLVWAELFKIQAICLWCTVVHVVTFLLFVVVMFGQILIEPAPTRQRYKDRAR